MPESVGLSEHEPEPAAPLLGLVRHARAAYRQRDRVTTYYRDLIGGVRVPNQRPAVRCVCVWCRRNAPTRAKNWHPECGHQHQLARGLTEGFYGALLPRRDENGNRRPCEECGAVTGSMELDHRMALSVAHHLGYRWRVRAHLQSNLRWLCEECHQRKTRQDRRTLAVLRCTDRMLELLAREWGPMFPRPPRQRELLF